MKQEINDALQKKIKKNIYGKTQNIKIIFPSGLGKAALQEINAILESLWFAKQQESKLSLLKNEIRIDQIHLFAIMELLMRSQCIADIRLIIFQGRTSGKAEFEKKCRDVPWDFYLKKNMSLKIKVNSVASRAFHESGLKEILSHILKNDVKEIVSGENTNETTCLYADLYKNKLTLSISLAGKALYKRGYRGILSASAPLREDAASCCIQNALIFAKNVHENFNPNTIIIPFSGTGTFAFEYFQSYFRFFPVLFGREYALQEMAFFKEESFNYLVKKAKEHCKLAAVEKNEHPIHFYCIDTSDEANSALLDNIESFQQSIIKNNFLFPNELFSQYHENFFKMNFANVFEQQNIPSNDIFILFNPPYGIRLNHHSDTVALYKNIALKINEITKIINKQQQNLLGFILCPNEETWMAFYKHLIYSEIETYHFTQGGIDIRVCQFFNKSTI